MGDHGPWNSDANIFLDLVGIAALSFIVFGWICGIILAHRTTRIPAHHMPVWRKQCKSGWVMAIIGLSPTIASEIFSFLHWTAIADALLPFRLLWFLTFLAPLWWISGWIEARRPEKIMSHPNRNKEKQEGTWPPPPSTIGADRK